MKTKAIDTTKRTCSLCGTDRTPLTGGIYPVNDRRGDCLGLFGECCYKAVNDAVLQSQRRYGMVSRSDMATSILARARKLRS